MDPTETVPAEAGETAAAPFSGHETAVVRHFVEWDDFYRRIDGCHVGLFEPGQAPDELGAPLSAILELRAAGMRRLVDAVTAPAGIGPGDHVVDAGCGLGSVAMRLARKHGCRVTGVNFVPRQLEHARKQAERAGLAGQVRFLWANCSQALPFEDASVDVVVCMEAACHFQDRSRFLREVTRILKPGGRLVLEDFMIPDGLASEDYREHIEPLCRAWAAHSLESRGGYTRELEAAGLELVEYADFGAADAYNVRAAEFQHKRSALQLLGGADPGPVEWHLAWASLALAWRRGHMLHERFLARKP